MLISRSREICRIEFGIPDSIADFTVRSLGPNGDVLLTRFGVLKRRTVVEEFQAKGIRRWALGQSVGLGDSINIAEISEGTVSLEIEIPCAIRWRNKAM